MAVCQDPARGGHEITSNHVGEAPLPPPDEAPPDEPYEPSELYEPSDLEPGEFQEERDPGHEGIPGEEHDEIFPDIDLLMDQQGGAW